MLSATPVRPPTLARLKPPKISANVFIWKPGIAVGVALTRKWLWETEPNGSGILPICIFPARFRSSINFMPASTSGMWLARFIPMMRYNRNAGSLSTRISWITAGSRNWLPPLDLLRHHRWSCLKPFELNQTTSSIMPGECVIQSSAASTCLLAQGLSKLVVRRSLAPD